MSEATSAAITWGVPLTALLLAGVNILMLWLSSRDFDRRYGRPPK
jgi:hypothetical protein